MALNPNDYSAATEISALWEERKRHRHPMLERMHKIQRAYNGDWSVPLPELDADEAPAVANLLALGVDQYAQRIASVVAALTTPSLRPGIALADNRAADRRKAILGWWQMNKLQTLDRRRARHWVAYGLSPVSIGPVSLSLSDKREIPFWRVRNPLGTFPAPCVDPDDIEPSDCIFVDYRPLEWLSKNYPEQTRLLSKGEDSDTDMFTVLEYVDESETALVVLGKSRREDPWERAASNRGVVMQQLLSRAPNRAGICPVVAPGRITLDRLQGQMDQALGIYQRQAKLDALETIAISRNVFPNEWIVSTNGRARLIRGADGKRGIRGEIENGNIMVNHLQVDQNTGMALDRMERNMRLTAGIPAEFGGESPSNVRTARRGAAVLSGDVDMPLQEAQESFARSKEAENTRAIMYQKAYYGKKPTMFLLGRDGVVTHNDYVPDLIFDTTATAVEYPMPGSDINGLVVQVGQLVGIKAMSLETAMTLLPMIKDVVGERDRVEVEGMRAALLSAIEQGAVAGQIDPHMLAQIIIEKITNHVPIEEAVASAEDAAQKKQAAQQNAAAPPGAPGAPAPGAPPVAGPDGGSPATPGQQPGINENPANPAVPAQPGAPAGGSPSLESLLAQLHTPIQTGGAAPAHVAVGAP